MCVPPANVAVAIAVDRDVPVYLDEIEPVVERQKIVIERRGPGRPRKLPRLAG